LATTELRDQHGLHGAKNIYPPVTVSILTKRELLDYSPMYGS
jgi:ribosomal protein S15P/S13E